AGVLVERGLAGLVVWRVVHDDAADIGSHRQLGLDVGVDLDVPGVAVELRWARVTGRADRVQRPAVHVDVGQVRAETRPEERGRVRGDVRLRSGRQPKEPQGDARALAPRPHGRGPVDGVGLRGGQAAAGGATAVAKREVHTVVDQVKELLPGRVAGLT